MWLCGACGQEYKHSIAVGMPTDNRGQDLMFNYVAFITIPFGAGTKTLCAAARAPDDYLQAVISVLKCIAAVYPCELPRGIRAGMVDMMIRSNDMYEAMIEGFPKITKEIVRPCHVGWGTDLEIAGNGLINLCEADIGTTMTFLDMSAAMKQAFFGTNAPAWGNGQWSELVDYLVHGIHLSESQWDSLEYHPRVGGRTREDR
jgi:hypothetical protein